MKTESVLKHDGGHTHGVGSVSFSADGCRLISVGIDPNSLLAIWEWESAKMLCIVKGHSDRIFDSSFISNSDSMFVTVGVKHIKVWNLMGNTLKSKRGVFGDSGTLQTVLCCCKENERYKLCGIIYVILTEVFEVVNIYGCKMQPNCKNFSISIDE